jgi:hypothetical protein
MLPAIESLWLGYRFALMVAALALGVIVATNTQVRVALILSTICFALLAAVSSRYQKYILALCIAVAALARRSQCRHRDSDVFVIAA